MGVRSDILAAYEMGDSRHVSVTRELGSIIGITIVALLIAVAGSGPAAAQEPTRGRAFAGNAAGGGGGSDQEQVVADTIEYPARAVGTLTFTQAGSPGTCTAFLVDKNSLLTAAHCVHGGSGDTPDAWSTGIVFDPGHNGTATPYRTCNGVEAHAPDAWRTGGDERVDYAVVQLDCGIGRQVGWFGLWLSGRGNDLDGLGVKVRGYPDDLAGTQWRGGGRVTGTTPRLVFHNARTRGDADGGPVYVATPASGGPCALTVQADEPHGGAGVHAGGPHGPRFTQEPFAQILGWAAENG